MITENFRTLIEKLKQKTTSKQAIWTKTSRDNEFKLELQKGAITTDWFDDGSQIKWIDLIIYNDTGDVIDRIAFSSEEGADYAYVLDLHSMANRAYFKVDETIQGIFNELDSDKIVGKESKN